MVLPMLMEMGLLSLTIQIKKMKKNIAYFSLVLLILACSKDDDSQDNASNADIDIHVVGQKQTFSSTKAVYWKNGKETILPSNGNSSAIGIYISNIKDVYIAGTENNASTPRPVYWKNGEKIMLESESNLETRVSDIVVQNDGSVYVTGFERSNSTFKAIYWKNGVKTYLHDNSLGGSLTNSIYITPFDDVFIAGTEIDVASFGSRPVYWKNGTRAILSTGGSSSGAYSIHVADAEGLYVSGSESSKAVYWKNGERIVLSDEDLISGITSIYTTQNKVYVAASEKVATADSNNLTKAIYWVDGKKIDLFSDTEASFISQITVVDNDIYVVGGARQSELFNAFDACYWKNGKITVLTDGSSIASASGIAITKKSN